MRTTLSSLLVLLPSQTTHGSKQRRPRTMPDEPCRTNAVRGSCRGHRRGTHIEEIVLNPSPAVRT